MTCTNVTLETMTVDQWIAVPGYYANRDVEKRMNKPHLKGGITAATQTLVKAVRKDGELIKIDGHSRARAWERGRLAKPELLYVVIFEVTEDRDIDRIYDAETSKLTAATGAEIGYAARKRLGFEPLSKFGQSSFQTAFNLLRDAGESTEETMIRFKEELFELDKMALPFTSKEEKKRLSQTVKAMMLRSLQDDRDVAVMFWRDYVRDTPVNPAVEAFLAAMDKIGTGTNAACVGQVASVFTAQFGVFKATVQG